jgi:hypothetical protein
MLDLKFSTLFLFINTHLFQMLVHRKSINHTRYYIPRPHFRSSQTMLLTCALIKAEATLSPSFPVLMLRVNTSTVNVFWLPTAMKDPSYKFN